MELTARRKANNDRVAFREQARARWSACSLALLIAATAAYLAAGCTQAVQVPKPTRPANEASVASGPLLLSLRVTPPRARVGQVFSAKFWYRDTSRSSTQTVQEASTYVRVRSSAGDVVFDSGARVRLMRRDLRRLEIKPGGSLSETVRFSLKAPGRYEVEAFSDSPPILVTPPVRVTVTE